MIYFNTEEGRGPRGATETGSNHEAAETVDQTRGIEVEDQADPDAAHAQIRLQLRLVRRQNGRDRLHLQNDLAIHHNVGAKTLAYLGAFVRHRDANLPLKREAGVIKFEAPALLINGFQETAPRVTVELRSPER